MNMVTYTQEITQAIQQPAGACILRVTLPLPPGINQSYRPGRDGRSIHATKALNQFKDEAYFLLADKDNAWFHWDAIARIYQLVATPPYQHTPLIMRTRIYTKTLWYYDIDAFGKACTDALFRKLDTVLRKFSAQRDLARYDNLIVDERTTKEIDEINEPRIEIELYCACTGDE